MADDRFDPLPEPRERPRLIQRMLPRGPDEDTRPGLPDWRMAYMGAAEFEWGALPAALRRMTRAADTLSVRAHSFLWVTVWAVAAEAGREAVDALLLRELGQGADVEELRANWRLKERTLMASVLSDGAQDMAWWAIDAAPAPFAIFRTQQQADDWLEVLRLRSSLEAAE